MIAPACVLQRSNAHAIEAASAAEARRFVADLATLDGPGGTMAGLRDDLLAAVSTVTASPNSSTRWESVARAFSHALDRPKESVQVKGKATRTTIWNVVSEVMGKQFGAKMRLELVVIVFDDRTDKKRFADAVETDLRTAEEWVARGAFKAVVFLHVDDAGTPSVTHLIQSGATDLRAPLMSAFPDLEFLAPKAIAAFPEDAAAGSLPDDPPPETVQELAAELHVPEEWLEEVVSLLSDSKALVFYGPPGTGKSFIAQAIARFLQPRADLRRLVQLHPSFAYESFFEGYRPAAGSAGMTLKKVHGPLRRLASSLENEPREDGFLILDEMNRGNLPKVFGELYFLLEYRNATVELMYSEAGDEFGLPSRLHLIGTMNTADRSVSVLDQALRRRFSFVPLYPDAVPLAPSDGHPGVLRQALQSQPDFLWIADVLDLVNRKLFEQLSDRDVAVGPSHFLGHPLTEALVVRRWKYFVLPAVQAALGTEDPAEMAEFDLEVLRAEVRAGRA